MPLQQSTRDFMHYLQKNPGIRARIAAPRDTTLLYAGNFFRPLWQEIATLKLSEPTLANKRTLPDVLAGIATPGQAHGNLLAWAKALDAETPWRDNGFIAWRALSGIFAANATGSVSFSIGSGITRQDKVFAATELSVLMRNPNVDGHTRAMLSYYDRCIRGGQSAINIGFIAG